MAKRTTSWGIKADQYRFEMNQHEQRIEAIVAIAKEDDKNLDEVALRKDLSNCNAIEIMQTWSVFRNR